MQGAVGVEMGLPSASGALCKSCCRTNSHARTSLLAISLAVAEGRLYAGLGHILVLGNALQSGWHGSSQASNLLCCTIQQEVFVCCSNADRMNDAGLC